MEKINGVVEKYYENGQLSSRENYEDGELNGLRDIWDRDGKLWSMANYKDGAVE